MTPPPSAALSAFLTSNTPLRVSPDPTPTIFLPLLDTPFPIFLTPPQPHDAPHQVETLNNPAIALSLNTPPFPFSLTDGDERSAQHQARHDAAVARWEKELEEGGTGWAPPESGLSLRVLRKDDPVSGEWIGELGMSRWKFDEVVDLEERKRLFEGNFKLAAGDERVVWSVGYLLHPDYHGKGIMTLALGALINKYIVPVLNAREIRTGALAENWASKKTMEKNGFVHTGAISLKRPENRGGGESEAWAMTWTRP